MDVTTTSVFAYRDEIIVELVGSGDRGSIDVRSYQFGYDDGSYERVVPKHPIDDDHRSAVETALADHGYQLAAPES